VVFSVEFCCRDSRSFAITSSSSSSLRSPCGPLRHSTVTTVDTGVPVVTRRHSDVDPDLAAPGLSWSTMGPSPSDVGLPTRGKVCDGPDTVHDRQNAMPTSTMVHRLTSVTTASSVCIHEAWCTRTAGLSRAT